MSCLRVVSIVLCGLLAAGCSSAGGSGAPQQPNNSPDGGTGTQRQRNNLDFGTSYTWNSKETGGVRLIANFGAGDYDLTFTTTVACPPTGYKLFFDGTENGTEEVATITTPGTTTYPMLNLRRRSYSVWVHAEGDTTGTSCPWEATLKQR